MSKSEFHRMKAEAAAFEENRRNEEAVAAITTPSVASGAPTDDPLNSQYFGKMLSRLVEFGFEGGHDENLIAWIRAYGKACAAAEREQIAKVFDKDGDNHIADAIRNRK